MIESILIFGVINGLTYALIALGFTLVYGISGMVNLTHGAFFIIGAYLYGILFTNLLNVIPENMSYLTPALAMISSVLITSLIGGVFYRITLHQILGDEVGILIVSICGCMIFQQLIYVILGTSAAFQSRVDLPISGKITLLNTNVLAGQMFAATISIIAFTALAIFISKTKIGRAMKALSQDIESAMLMGVSTEKLYILTTSISAGLASLAGILYTGTTTSNVSAYMWLLGLAISFTIVVLGGLGSIKGSIIGGLIFGLAETAFIKIVPAAGDLQRSFPFIVILIILLIRPKGLFGKRVEME
ncbi:MAG: branched-chain amino acid ABC transporter permease [Candidatus Bathyarchaeia archaeon]